MTDPELRAALPPVPFDAATDARQRRALHRARADARARAAEATLFGGFAVLTTLWSLATVFG